MLSDLHFDSHRHYPAMDSETGVMSIDQGGEWGKRLTGRSGGS